MTRLRALTMPKWGIEMTEGNLAEWKIRPGDSVRKGQIIAVVETDKIANDIECEYDAVVARILAAEGKTYPVGAPLAVLADEAVAEPEVDKFVSQFGAGGWTAAPDPAAAAGAAPVKATAAGAPERPAATIPARTAISSAAQRLALQRGVDVTAIRGSGPRWRITYQDVDQASKPAVQRAPSGPVSIEPTTHHLDGVFASAYAKRLAVRHSVDLSRITGTGDGGRISRQDVAQVIGDAPAVNRTDAAQSPEPQQQPRIVRMTPMRKAIARQLTLAKSTIPHFYLRATVRIDALLALRARANQANPDAATLNDYFLRGAALALREVPDVNVQVHEDAIHQFPHADIAFAVATDKGLTAPIIRSADSKSLAVIAEESRLLAERARDGKLRAADLEGGTFTVTNLGMFGIDQFDAIINPPQGAILAIGAARRQMVPGDHAWEQATAVMLSLSCDHRAIDGAVGARFMGALRALIEDPGRL